MENNKHCNVNWGDDLLCSRAGFITGAQSLNIEIQRLHATWNSPEMSEVSKQSCYFNCSHHCATPISNSNSLEASTGTQGGQFVLSVIKVILCTWTNSQLKKKIPYSICLERSTKWEIQVCFGRLHTHIRGPTSAWILIRGYITDNRDPKHWLFCVDIHTESCTVCGFQAWVQFDSFLFGWYFN